jgi:copper oxidase (laccase) domain-containing protein
VWLAGRVDGLVTRSRGVLLASTAADCVPVYLLDSATGVVGLVHAGWRGVAGGIFGTGLARALAMGAELGGVRVHLGPAICGPCYEVDGPVLGALGLPGERAHVDLRGLLARQAVAAGLDRLRVSCSAWCTRCAGAELHSHRGSGGQAGRMAAFIGLRGTAIPV